MVMKNKLGQGMKSKISPASLYSSKKAQMKIQQMSFMLIAVVMFFALVGMFILVIKFSDIKNRATELQEENAMLLVTKLANSPEFSCGESFGTSKTDCIDLDKVMMLKENINKYKGFWGIDGIEIRVIYPGSTNEIECTPSEYPNCNLITIMPASGYDHSNFVALCRKEKIDNKIKNKCELGKIIMRYEEVE